MAAPRKPARVTRIKHEPETAVEKPPFGRQGIEVLYQQAIARIVPDEKSNLTMEEAAFVEICRHSAGVDLAESPGVYTVPIDHDNGDVLTVTVGFKEAPEPRNNTVKVIARMLDQDESVDAAIESLTRRGVLKLSPVERTALSKSVYHSLSEARRLGNN